MIPPGGLTLVLVLILIAGCAIPNPPVFQPPPEHRFEDIESVTSLSGLMPILEETCRKLQKGYDENRLAVLETQARRLRAGARRIESLFAPYPLANSPSVSLLTEELEHSATLIIDGAVNRNNNYTKQGLSTIQASCNACHMQFRN